MGTYAAAYKPAYTPNGSIPRPVAKSYQEQEQNNAEDLWNDQYNTLSDDQKRSAALRDSSQTQAQDALTKFNSDKASNVGAFKATNTMDYQPTQVGQWLASLGGSLSRAPAPTTASGGAAVRPVVAASGSPSSALAAFDPSQLTNFDPSAAGKEYADGAYGDFKNKVSDQLNELQNKSVAAGRLHSGLFDADSGNVITRLGSDYSNAIAQEAGVFSGQREAALQGGKNLAYQRASDIDRNTETAAEARAAESAKSTEDANNFSLGQYQDETQRYSVGLSGAEQADQMGYQKASDLDKYSYNQAQYQDDQNFQREQTGLNAALNEEGRYNDEYNTSADRMGSYVSSTRDWANQDREAQDLRDQIALLRAQQRGGGNSAGGSPAPTSTTALQKQALALGVPYRP